MLFVLDFSEFNKLKLVIHTDKIQMGDLYHFRTNNHLIVRPERGLNNSQRRLKWQFFYSLTKLQVMGQDAN